MPLTPSSKGEKALGMYMRGITKEDRQKERDEVLSTNANTIKEYANLIGDIMNKDFICVVGDEKKIKANKDEFKTLINVFN